MCVCLMVDVCISFSMILWYFEYKQQAFFFVSPAMNKSRLAEWLRIKKEFFSRGNDRRIVLNPSAEAPNAKSVEGGIYKWIFAWITRLECNGELTTMPSKTISDFISYMIRTVLMMYGIAFGGRPSYRMSILNIFHFNYVGYFVGLSVCSRAEVAYPRKV